ncbi:sensor histidine kinase [Paenibacillus glycanilyticus]|uniref:HAMP domain-containing protein n=1 Tax=Paenibacillus glycanilyticus TaxID=126569 RepID=A0ABQ6GJA0_9BACL|nr:histidine kinase [Paenibacillus glycanilyticus]GLX70979.1 hypothetical protein MU1_53270 [Paenibacillus glycanilyticus]
MTRHRPVFLKMNAVILILLLLIILMYTYFSRTSFHVIDSQMIDYKESQLMFLKYQIETNAERLSLSSNILVRDSSILDLQLSILTKDYYRTLDFQTHLKEKLYLQSLSSTWSNNLFVYLPAIQLVVSTELKDTYNQRLLDEAVNGKWRFQPGDSANSAYYQLFLWDPGISNAEDSSINAVFEVRFGLDNIAKTLQHYNQDSPGNSFLLTADGSAFSDVESNNGMYEEFGADLMKEGLHGDGHTNVKFNGEQVFVSYVYLPELDAYLMDYVPVSLFYKPIIDSRNLFYIGMVIIIVLGLIASYTLYLHVQRPVKMIMKGLKHFEMGDYSFRIHRSIRNEFDYMIQRFNDMGTTIQHLIQDVYEEQNRSRLATLKQLQSQINPHFLYNCLSFIAACAKVGRTDRIKDMVYHLGGYYRYITRVENQMPLLQEEIELVTHYMEIYTFRLERIDYRIDIPQAMWSEPVMRLILQPVVENAIVHGIEPKPGRGTVFVTGHQEPDWNILMVEDSGNGMTDKEIAQYLLQLDQPVMDDSSGCGLWNVHQRLKQRFGPEAGVFIQPSGKLSGLSVKLRWKRNLEGELL